SRLLNTPPSVPAYSVLGDCGSSTSRLTDKSLKPVLIACQLTPPFVLLNTPFSGTPAYRVLGASGSIASLRTERRRSGLASISCQCAAPSVLLYTPKPVPT